VIDSSDIFTANTVEIASPIHTTIYMTERGMCVCHKSFSVSNKQTSLTISDWYKKTIYKVVKKRLM